MQELVANVAQLVREHHLRAVVVEKNHRLRLLLEATLRGLGFEVFSTDDAKQFVVMQFREPFDIVLFRWNHGEESGRIMEAMVVLCDELPRLIVLCGSETGSFSSAVPVAAFLFEPFKVEDVVRTVWEALGDIHA